MNHARTKKNRDKAERISLQFPEYIQKKMQICPLNLDFAHMFFSLKVAYSRFSCDVTAAMFVYRTIVKKGFFLGFDSIIMRNLSDILPLICTPIWPSHYVSENQELAVLMPACDLAVLTDGDMYKSTNKQNCFCFEQAEFH